MILLRRISRIAVFGRLLFLPFFRCSPFRLHALQSKIATVIFFIISSTLFSGAHAAQISLESDTDTATAGYFQLSWKSREPATEFVLQESGQQNFATAKIIYQGNDLARVISGKPDSTYFYRIADIKHPDLVSNTVKVTVTHHPLSTAFGFFTVGALVFIATVIVIFRGSR